MAFIHPAQRRPLQERRLILGGSAPGRRDLALLSAASLLAAALAAGIRAVEPFEHGIWLVAYLFLVGFLAQLLLGAGQSALLRAAGRPAPPRRARRGQLVLWNLGVVAVPVGVLAGARLAVVIGGVALLAALDSFSSSARPVLATADTLTGLRCGYLALLWLMAASTFVGTGLAWDMNWL